MLKQYPPPLFLQHRPFMYLHFKSYLICMKKVTANPTAFLIIMLCHSLTGLGQLNNPKGIEYAWKTDTAKKQIDLGEIDVVLPRKSFESLNFPHFVDKEQAYRDYFIHEPVISVNINGEAKAYPLNLLTMHEISNDSCGGLPILVTFCPLCNSSVVFDRRLQKDGAVLLLEFEVSGMLRHSDMVMADLQTETWWQQLMGEGLVGEYAGNYLEIMASMVLSVEEFFAHYPHGKIVDRHTGLKAEPEYGSNPYFHYDSLGKKPWSKYYHRDADSRLEPMERIISVRGNKGYKVYALRDIAQEGVINDILDERPIVIFYETGAVSVLDEKDIKSSRSVGTATVFSPELNGQLLTFHQVKSGFMDEQTKSIWDIAGLCLSGPLKGKELIPVIHTIHFAFAWLTFNPDSEIYNH